MITFPVRSGWVAKSEEKNNDTLLRPLILSTLGHVGFPKVIEEARRMFDRHYIATMQETTSGDQKTSLLIPADLRIAVFSTIMHHGTEADYHKLIEVST